MSEMFTVRLAVRAETAATSDGWVSDYGLAITEEFGTDRIIEASLCDLIRYVGAREVILRKTIDGGFAARARGRANGGGIVVGCCEEEPVELEVSLEVIEAATRTGKTSFQEVPRSENEINERSRYIPMTIDGVVVGAVKLSCGAVIPEFSEPQTRRVATHIEGWY